MLLYVGPDQLIPLSGILGTAAGLALIFWGRVMNGLRRMLTAFQPASGRQKFPGA